MIHIRKILHPTDFSDNSNNALKYACAFARHFGSELHLVHVITDLSLVTLPPVDSYLPDGYYEEARKHSEQQMTDMPDKDLIGDSPVVRSVLEGAIFPEIVKYAQAKEIDLIIMGTHGYSGLSHMVIGSVAEKVVRKSPCPVLTVHPEGHEFVMP